ncbi:uncharacterized protein [Henckelia pumila]|uniref:uncharacterized protein n=1 Tax=Henckelia pumila TaxID=405737 RepID=UPI003C6E85C7
MKKAARWRGSELFIREKEALVEKLSSQEEVFRKQQSKNNLLRWGNRNSKFFHAQSVQRKSRNTIHGILTAHDDFSNSPQVMANFILEYFGTIFTSSKPSTSDIEVFLSDLEPMVTQNMNSILCAPFTAEEVKKVLFYMHLDKAPSPDVMMTLFFQKFWSITGGEITKPVLKVFNDGDSLEDWNDCSNPNSILR